ncbi:MAG: endo-1,4-beta-xylanase [Bacteroidales bacterium]|nr:endo-1,4-beta-xylanase [Bacteroidales bacterium]
MKKTLTLFAFAALGLATANAQSLQQSYRDYWRTGISVNQWEVKAEKAQKDGVSYSGAHKLDQTSDYALIAQHFGWVVPENCMKSEVIHPQEGVYDFTLADQLVEKARANGQHIVGHCLIWHEQCSPWFFVDENGKQVSAEVLKERMRDHIFTILGHFRGKIEAWDVVNEAFNDDGSLRRSKFYEILGEDFIPLAFQYAREADPTIELYYNDYSMYKPEKVKAVVNFFRPLMAKGLRVDAIGMQGHLILDDADYVNLYEKSIKEIATLGIPAQFTELDLSVLPNPYKMSGANITNNFEYSEASDPYKNGLPANVQKKVDQFWIDFYKMLMRNHENVLRLTFWCFNDANSWRNDWPIKGRTEYATLFDRNSKPKPTIQKLIDLVKKGKK